MQYKSIFNLILIVLAGIGIFIQSEHASAQEQRKDRSKKKDFGWSLKKFEKKGDSRNKKDGQESVEENIDSGGEEIIRVDTDLIVSDVLVVNEKGNAILGLRQNDFVITEDDIEQKSELFAAGESAALPRSIVLIMRTVGRTKLSWVKNSIEAANVLIDKLAPQDKMAIVITEQKLVLDFTQDKALLKKTVGKLESNPNANARIWREWGTLMAVLGEMFDEKDARPIVIYQASGWELNYLKGEFAKMHPQAQESFRKNRYYERFGGERGYSFRDVLERVDKSRATIYSIIPYMRFVGLTREEQLKRARTGIEEMWRLILKKTDPNVIAQAADQYQEEEAHSAIRNEIATMQVAKLSGGYTEFVEKPEDARTAYETIFNVINNRYTVGYYSTNQTRDGKRRSVKIEVRGHPEYTIVGRKYYLPSADSAK